MLSATMPLLETVVNETQARATVQATFGLKSNYEIVDKLTKPTMKKIASAFCMTLAVLWLRLGQTDTVENEPEVIVGLKGGPGGEEKNLPITPWQACNAVSWLSGWCQREMTSRRKDMREPKTKK